MFRDRQLVNRASTIANFSSCGSWGTFRWEGTVPATRLLVVADSKMLAALANGLREGGAFDVAVASLAEPAAAQAAAAEAEAVVLFYGGPVAVQALAAKLRDRGGRVVAVLQASQHAQRDECFRAGASDLLFMPMPKDHFVTRLQQSCGLSFESSEGVHAEVTAVARNATVKLEDATVIAGGVESAAATPFKAGDTVRLTFGPFQAWGLVVRPEGPLQIRFAGLTADEEGQVRKWVDAGGVVAALTAAKAAPEAAPAASDAPAAVEAPASSETPTAEAPLITPLESSAAQPGEAPRAAPAFGPPPGFADRKPVRASTRPQAVRGPPPILTPPSVTPVARPAAQPAAALAAGPDAPEAAAAPPAATQSAPAAEAKPALDLFDEDKPEAAAPAVPTGPLWPTLYSPQSCRTAALFLLQDKSVSSDAPVAVVASARKVTGGLGSEGREALQKAGSDSHFADALAARVALDAAATEAGRLYAVVPAPSVDADAVATLTRQADEAAVRLQKEANSAVTKGEVESLQLITAASAALSRDLLSFKETADRLRGMTAAPRLGAGALDPDVAVPGQPLRTQSNKPVAKQQPQLRDELRDFTSLDGMKSGSWQKIGLAIGLVVFVVAAANAFYFSVPHAGKVQTESAGPNVQQIEYVNQSALVTIAVGWRADLELQKLLPVLREHNIERATLIFPTGRIAGTLNVTTGKVAGLPPPPK
jgi:CheY-like chemotaxis protein